MTTLAVAEAPPPQFQVITITGRLTPDPELRKLPDGGTVCKLRLAVDAMAAGRQTGYINVSAFRPGSPA